MSRSFMVPSARAEGEFETDYDVTYDVNNEGSTTVTQKITLKNKTPNFYDLTSDTFFLLFGVRNCKSLGAKFFRAEKNLM